MFNCKLVPKESTTFSTITMIFTNRKHLEVRNGLSLDRTLSTWPPLSASAAAWWLLPSVTQPFTGKTPSIRLDPQGNFYFDSPLMTTDFNHLLRHDFELLTNCQLFF